MKILYAKCVLFGYPHLKELTEQIDNIVEKKALGSMSNFSPCLFQCEEILDLTEQKKNLIFLLVIMKKITLKLTREESVYLDYKYFKRLPKDVYLGFDFSSRNYFRKQVRLAEKVAYLLEQEGVDDQCFEQKFLIMDFFKEMLKRVEEIERSSRKNKPVKEKNVFKSNIWAERLSEENARQLKKDPQKASLLAVETA